MITTKWCPRCQTEKHVAEWGRNAARPDGLNGYCHSCQTEVAEISRKKKRLELLVEMGGVCQWHKGCDWTDLRSMTIDHVHGGGNAERDGSGTAAFYRKVRANRENYQLLCADHNIIKRIENEEHKGAREYVRVPPVERLPVATDRSDRWSSERRAQQSRRAKDQMADPDFKAKFLSAPNPRRAGKTKS